jgi:hypothetical protein
MQQKTDDPNWVWMPFLTQVQGGPTLDGKYIAIEWGTEDGMAKFAIALDVLPAVFAYLNRQADRARALAAKD